MYVHYCKNHICCVRSAVESSAAPFLAVLPGRWFALHQLQGMLLLLMMVLMLILLICFWC